MWKESELGHKNEGGCGCGRSTSVSASITLPPTTSLLPPKVLGRGILGTICSRTALAF